MEQPQQDITILPNFQIQKTDKCIMTVQFSPDNKLIACAGDDFILDIFDVSSKQKVYSFQDTLAKLLAISFSFDGQYIATSGEDRVIRIYQLQTQLLKYQYTDNGGEIFCLCFSPKGELVSAGADYSIRFYDIQKGLQFQIKEKMIIYACKFSHDGKLLASGGQEKILRIYDSNNKSLKFQLKHSFNSIYCIAFSHDDKLIATGGADKVCYLINVQQKLLIHSFHEFQNSIMSMSFQSNGMLAIAGFENYIMIFDTKDFKLKYKSDDLGCMNVCTDISQDGQLLVVGGEDSFIRFYNLWKPVKLADF